MTERLIPPRVKLRGLLTGQAIREWMRNYKASSPWAFYRAYQQAKPTTSYNSVYRYFYMLKEMGLIEVDRVIPLTEKNPLKGKSIDGKPIEMTIYKPVWELIDDPRWMAPQGELYPATRLGKERYAKRKREGREPRGRRTPYRRG